jgi:hypothetical protein
MKYQLTKSKLNKIQKSFNFYEYQLKECKLNGFKLTNYDLENLLNLNINPNLIIEIRTFYEFSNEYKIYADENGCTINEDVLYSTNPAMYMFSYNFTNTKNLDLEESIYNPYTLDYAVKNSNLCKYANFYYLLNLILTQLFLVVFLKTSKIN